MNDNFDNDKNTAQWIVDELWMNAIKKQNAPISRQYLTLITPSQGRYLTIKINYFSVKVKVIVVIVLVSWVLINVNCKYYVIRSNKKSTETSVYWIKIQTLGVFTVTLYYFENLFCPCKLSHKTFEYEPIPRDKNKSVFLANLYSTFTSIYIIEWIHTFKE